MKLENIDKVKKQKEYINKVKQINNKGKYSIITFGCSQNESDSETIAGMLNEMGYIKSNLEDSNVIVLNTCCIRENAENTLFGKLGELKKLHNKGAIVVLCGCMMQEEHILEKLKKSYSFVDIIFGTHTLYKFPELMYDRLQGKKYVISIDNIDGNIYEDLPVHREDKYSANITIMNGCNNFCTYCIVPYVRGRERSREPKDIIDEVRELAKQGYKEINLLGQNVNSYLESENLKKVDYDKYLGIDSFAKLLDEICKIDGIEVVKFLSPHPKNFTDDVIDTIARNKKISRMIHLPLQSGSTSVLDKMNRKYTKQTYLKLVEKMREKIDDIKFSTDIIVGFPGETEEDFEDTLDVVRQVNFEQIFMFIYSRRIGTLADKMTDQVDEDIKHKRFDRLKEEYDKQIDINNEKYVGKVEKVFVEGISKNNKDMLTARNIANKVIVFEGDKDLIGKTINVKILSNHKWYLKGKII